MSANAGEIRARLVLSNDEFKRKMNETREDMKKTSFSSKQLTKDFDYIRKASLAVGGAVVAGIGGSVKVAASFEQGMARVKAITGATEDEFGRLEAAARKAGAETIFSATDGADALSYLAMAGFSVNEQILALPAVLNAAIAGNIELADSADMVSNIMTGFGITAEETGHAVDVLVTAFTTANTDLPMIAEGMKYVAPVAKSLGWTLEDTATALGKLSDAGIQGSQSGTVLRASLLSLANPTGQTAKTMKDLNIEVTDAQGKMKSLPELIGHIASKMEGMSEAQRTQTAAQLVGTQAASGFIALLDVGQEELARYSKELENSAGKAQEMADVQADTLVGSFKEFQSAMEEAGIKLGKEFLPLFTDIVRYGTDVVSTLTKVDTTAVKSSLAFAGTAAAIGLVISTIGKLAIATKGLMASMGPAGWLILGVSLLGGALASAAVYQDDFNKVSLEAVYALDEQRVSLENNVNQYENLMAKSRLTNDELARFVDINSLISQTADPEIIARLKDEQDKLREKSGLTNEELDTLIGLNGEILEVVPESSVVLTEQGNVLLENTDAAKAFNKEQLELIRLDLEAQKTKAESNMADYLKEEKKLQQDINKLQEKKIDLDKDEQRHQIRLAELKQQFADAKARNDTYEMDRLRNMIESEEHKLEAIKKQRAKNSENVLEKTKELQEIKKQIGALDEVVAKMVEIELKQVGLVSEKGKELETINKTIDSLKKQKKEIEKTTPENAKNTREYKDQIRNIEGQISQLQTVNSRVKDIIHSAKNLNSELSKGITKNVTLVATHTGDPMLGPQRRVYHTGGIVGQPAINQTPKLHMGGRVSRLMSQLSDMPMHNEIDVRLLRNEMVLTEAQQANLMRMIDAGIVGTSREDVGPVIHEGSKFEFTGPVYMRDENDIKILARELNYLSTSRKRGGGIR